VQRVPAELVGGERDRIRAGHQIAVAEIDDGRVLPHARPHDHPGVAGHVLVEDGLQQMAGQLADWQERHRAP